MARRKATVTDVPDAPVDVRVAPVHRSLLHRLAEDLRTQNWTAIMLEFLVVVFGVFIGLQATNWNASLGDRRDEAAALQEIAADVRQDRRELAAGRSVALQRVAATRLVLSLARGEVPEDLNTLGGFNSGAAYLRSQIPDAPTLTPDERGSLWSVIVSGYYPSLATPAYDSLISSGRIDILRDEDLVREIQAYRLSTRYLALTQDLTLRPVSVTVRARGEAYGLSSFAAVDEQVLARQVAASPELGAMVESQLGWAVVHLQRIEAVDQIGAVLLERLDAEQGPERRP